MSWKSGSLNLMELSEPHRAFYGTPLPTLKTTMNQVSWVPSWSCSKDVYEPVWHIRVPSVQWINSWWRAEELPEACRVSCRSKFGKLVHLVGFIIKKLGLLYKDSPVVALHRNSPNVGITQNKGILRTKCRVFKWYSMWYVRHMPSFKQLILWNWSLKEGRGLSSGLSSHEAIF